MSNKFSDVLGLAPLHTTHWHIETNRFVRMGNAVVDGYLSLNILREIQSREYVRCITAGMACSIIAKCPDGADAYSFRSNQYFCTTGSKIKIVTDEGEKPLLNAFEIQDLFFVRHLLSEPLRDGTVKKEQDKIYFT